MQHTHESGRVEKTIGAQGPRGQTRRLLLEHASILLGQGQIASVAEVAQHASRILRVADGLLVADEPLARVLDTAP